MGPNTKKSKPDRKKRKDKLQTQIAFIIVSITIILLGTFFFGLHYLTKSSRNNDNDIATTNNQIEVLTNTAAPNQLVIIHSGQTVSLEKFGVTINVLKHIRLDDVNVDTEIMVQASNGTTANTQFSAIGEAHTINGYNIRLVNFTESAVQLVVQKP